jgi:hypothetical protein
MIKKVLPANIFSIILFAISGSPPDAAAAIRAAAAFASIFPPEISLIRIRKIQTSLIRSNNI